MYFLGIDLASNSIKLSVFDRKRDRILKNTNYKNLRKQRYGSFDNGNGAKYEKGALSLEGLSEIARANGEPQQISGKQELFEQIIANTY
ncbi:hypothetical protein [Flavobacterium undicola]|uniref:hypothetical protein n=1 Tax=Flavobacterium undicola TaxID=1932779 RepID=UPI00293BCCD2|nr:hypothetical protein [Flavobacterium undicola]